MGRTFYNLSCEELCDLMCGEPEEDYEEKEAIIKTTLTEGEETNG